MANCNNCKYSEQLTTDQLVCFNIKHPLNTVNDKERECAEFEFNNEEPAKLGWDV